MLALDKLDYAVLQYKKLIRDKLRLTKTSRVKKALVKLFELAEGLVWVVRVQFCKCHLTKEKK